MTPTANGPTSTQFVKHQREVVNTFARAAVAMRDAARAAEEFSNWFSRANDMKDISLNAESPASPSSDTVVIAKKRKADKDVSPPLDKNGKKKRAVKEKVPRDKDAPKRPPSAYILFQNEVRKEIKNEHPNMSNVELLKEVSKLWGTVSDKEKGMYVERHGALKSKYDEEKAAYDAKHGITPDEKKEDKPKKPRKKTITTSPKENVVSASRTKHPASEESDRESPQDEDEDELEQEAEPEADLTGEEEDEEEDDEGGNLDVESEIESEPEPPKKKAKVDDVQLNSRNPSAIKEKEKDKKPKKDIHHEEEKKKKKY